MLSAQISKLGLQKRFNRKQISLFSVRPIVVVPQPPPYHDLYSSNPYCKRRVCVTHSRRVSSASSSSASFYFLVPLLTARTPFHFERQPQSPWITDLNMHAHTDQYTGCLDTYDRFPPFKHPGIAWNITGALTHWEMRTEICSRAQLTRMRRLFNPMLVFAYLSLWHHVYLPLLASIEREIHHPTRRRFPLRKPERKRASLVDKAKNAVGLGGNTGHNNNV